MMAACVTSDAEKELKPFELANLLRAELDLPEYAGDDDHLLKPKEIGALANARLDRGSTAISINPTTNPSSSSSSSISVKEELQAIRATVRDLPPSFWTEQKARSGSSGDDLLTRLLAKPATAGGFAAGIAAKCLKPGVIDTKSVVTRGAGNIDGFTILRSGGAYSTVDFETENIAKAFKSASPSEKIGDCTFKIQERTQPSPGQSVMTAKASKCDARFVALVTPKWLLVGLFRNAGPESEDATMQLFEDLRLEVLAKA
jgi:hypothetical protein